MQNGRTAMELSTKTDKKTGNASLDKKRFRQILARNVALPLILMIGLSALFIAQMSFITANNHLVDHSDQAISMADNLLKQFVDAETGVRGYVITGRENFLEPYQSSSENTDAQLQELRNFVSDNSGHLSRLDDILALYHRWVTLSENIIKKRHDHQDVTMIADSEQGKNMMDELRKKVGDLVRVEGDLRKARVERAEETTRAVIYVTLLMSLLVGGALAFIGRKQLLGLSQTYEGALAIQTEQNARLERQAWIRAGHSDLSDRLRGEMSFQEVCDRAMNFLARYLGADVGALYVLDEGASFVRRSVFAFEPGKSKAERIRPGESLVGQVAITKEPIVLSELPENYIHVNSALGRAQPRKLLIAPSSVDGEVNAIYELGFLQNYDPKYEELVRQIAESLGTALRSALYKEKLRDLLEETQRQTEELQTQQEEVRVANEELEEQARALKESQVKLESSHAELEQSNDNLEEQARLLEHQKDQLTEKAEELAHSQTFLEAKGKDLEAANEYKSQFLANMSHELRTPLNSSLILAKLLMENKLGNLNSEQVNFASTIYSSGNDLLALINDILDLSKVEAGKLDLRPEQFTTSKLLENLRKTFAPVAGEKKLKFNIEVDPTAPEFIETDQQRLEQILKNLISNALKFTTKGSVTITTKAKGSNVSFQVVDTGIGVPASQQETIFLAFRQADQTTSRKFGGTGLGLTIARDLAMLLGGKIEVQSEEGKGSRFTLTIPVKFEQLSLAPMTSLKATVVETTRESNKTHTTRAPAVRSTFGWSDDRRKVEERRGETKSAQPGRKVLVLLAIEDDGRFAKVLYDLAHDLGFDCIVAESADDGFESALHYQPDAIILDLKLPDHTGLLVLDRLKSTTKTRHIPVHIISAAERSETALQMGAIGFLQKPAKLEDLQGAFRKLQDKVAADVKNVLVVEDDAVQRVSICKLISGSDIETTAVGTAGEALELLKTKTFDCMIVDLVLPDLSGYELLERLTSTDKQSYPPVIVYTGRDLTRDEEEKLRKYSKSVIIKGAKSPERLMDEVSLFLHRVESKFPQERQVMLAELRKREQVFENRKILVVDDDVRNIFALSSALEHRGAKIVVARNGREALQKLEGEQGVDLVLMDIMMPEMDGYQAMEKIRGNSKWSKLPIIALTAKAMRDDQEKCLSAGANDYLAKPIDLDKLFSLMRVWMPT
jgi:CheY-like chemotaxis protein